MTVAPTVLQVYYPEKLKACFECIRSLFLCMIVLAQESYIWTQNEPKSLIFIIAPLWYFGNTNMAMGCLLLMVWLMEKKNNRTLKKMFGVFQASNMFASYERRVLEGDRSTTILHNFIAVLESCEMHSATEIARRKQIVKDFHELKTEIMGLLEMNPVQIEMLDTQTIIQEAILQEKCVGRKERKAIERELEKIKIQFSKLEKDLKLKDEIIEEQLVYASTQEDYYQYKVKYNQLRNIFDN